MLLLLLLLLIITRVKLPSRTETSDVGGLTHVDAIQIHFVQALITTASNAVKHHPAGLYLDVASAVWILESDVHRPAMSLHRGIDPAPITCRRSYHQSATALSDRAADAMAQSDRRTTCNYSISP